LNHAFCFTVVNSNSPRLFDKPMAEGLIDFARAGQVVMMTPFCLMGAMAPVTIGGALVLQHAEALAGITLSQLARPGAPVVYGSFASNVDLRSGAPAFGTPEQVKATLISGQLARRIGLPWRASAGTSAPLADAQAAMETGAGVWAAALAGATITVHAAGWLEGGLTFGFEKFIADLDLLDLQCELRRPVETDPDALALEALAAIAPAGHFFGEAHTLARYRTAFHAPGLASTQGFEAWQETGRPDAETRATAVWQGRLGAWTPPEPPPGIETARAFAARRIAAGGATPG
jgi:trimethylamine--corrinoid protein Co-methyltransferase